MNWKNGKIKVLANIITGNMGGGSTFTKYYPIAGEGQDSAILTEVGGGVYELNRSKGFDWILQKPPLKMVPTPAGHLEANWTNIENGIENEKLEYSMTLTSFDVENDSTDPYPFLFSYYWRLNGKIVSFGLQGGSG